MLIHAGLCKYMEGWYFEEFIAQIYSFLGYDVSATTTTGDQGLDLILSKEGQGETIGIQCKRFKGNVGNGAVQEVFAGKHYYKCDKAIVITPGRFTASARTLAKALDVELIGLKELNQTLETIQDSLLDDFHKSDKLTEILINSTIDLIIEDTEGKDTIDSVRLLEHIFNYRNYLKDSLIKLLVNNLGIGFKRLGEPKKAINLYEEALAYISFENEADRYLIVGNLLVSYIENHDFKKGKALCNTVKKEELSSFSQEHFNNMEKEVEEGLDESYKQSGSCI